MCGIVGGAGTANWRSFVLEGLKKLDYRGYDSSGIAYLEKGNISLYRKVGRVDDLESILPHFVNAEGAIGHTRWATHGTPSDKNAHPHYSEGKYFYLVHNGVIENFKDLKNRLKELGYSFYSDTDTEVIANLLEWHFLNDSHQDILDSIVKTMKDLQGSYACAILCKESSNLYFMKNASPLLIGEGEGSNFLASDAVPMIGLASKFIDLSDGDYGYLNAHEVRVFHDLKETRKRYVERKAEQFSFDKGNYPHFMLKEIEEEPKVISRLIDNYFDDYNFLFDADMVSLLKESDDIIFLACGTSYYASQVGVSYMHSLNKRSEAFLASEWAYYHNIDSKHPVFILLSQSGETADIIACQKVINALGLINIAITNTKGSTLERQASFSNLLYAGLEVAVAATKSYVAQISFLALLTGAMSNSPEVVKYLKDLSRSIGEVIANKEKIHEIAKELVNTRDAFFVGRGMDFNASLECALKLKEISYIHSEAYAGGELKHGPIALIENETPIFGLVSDPVSAMALRNNLTELESRRAKVYVISSSSLSAEGDAFILPDVKGRLSCILEVVFGQYLSYFVSLEKGLPIDKPRNLAKSVTVQ